jgi:hypothetical protein
VAIFNGDYPQLQNTTISTSAGTQVYATSGSAVSHGGLTYTWNYISSTVANQAYTVINEGPNIAYIGTNSSMTAPTGGILLNPGEQLTVQGRVQNLYAAVSNGNSATILAALASNPSVV